jgi:hypothetical protein
VSFVDFLETTGITTAIGVMSHGQFTEGLAYIIVCGGARHTQYLIIVFHGSIIAAKANRVKARGAVGAVRRWLFLCC